MQLGHHIDWFFLAPNVFWGFSSLRVHGLAGKGGLKPCLLYTYFFFKKKWLDPSLVVWWVYMIGLLFVIRLFSIYYLPKGSHAPFPYSIRNHNSGLHFLKSQLPNIYLGWKFEHRIRKPSVRAFTRVFNQSLTPAATYVDPKNRHFYGEPFWTRIKIARGCSLWKNYILSFRSTWHGGNWVMGWLSGRHDDRIYQRLRISETRLKWQYGFMEPQCWNSLYMQKYPILSKGGPTEVGCVIESLKKESSSWNIRSLPP